MIGLPDLGLWNVQRTTCFGRDLPRQKMDSWAFGCWCHIVRDLLKIENIASSMMESVKRQVP